MNKTEFVEAVANKAGITKGAAQTAIDAALETIREQLKQGEGVVLTGFGSFAISKRAARAGRNPQTGAEIQIAARNVPSFTAGKHLKDAVN